MTPETIRNARRRLGLTQAQFARLLGFCGGHIIRRFEMPPYRKSHATPKGASRVLMQLVCSGRVDREDLERTAEDLNP